MSKLNLAIISFGRIGRVHMKNLYRSEKFDVKMVCDIVKPDDFDFCYPDVQFVKTYDEVLTNSEVQAVLIGTPTPLHPKQIIAAAEAGKHIFCEKPVGLDLDELTNVYKAVLKAGVICQVGLNRRFDDDFLNIKRRIAEIGKPQILKITSRDPAMPPVDYVKTSGGIFVDMAIHDFDMARYLFGEITSVHVIGDALVDPAIKNYDDVDTAITTLTFENGALGVIDNSRQAVYGYDQRLEVFGSKGMLQNINHTDYNTIASTATTICTDKPQYFFLERYVKSYATELDFFAQSVLEGKPTVCDLQDGIMAVVIAKAAGESLKTGKTVKIGTLER